MMRAVSIMGVVALAALLPLSVQASWMQINLDIQGDGNSGGYLSAYQDEAAYPHGPDADGEWNVLNIQALDGNPSTTQTDPSIALSDNTGAATPVVFKVIGDCAGWNGKSTLDSLVGDYLILQASFGLSPTYDFEISGLAPGGLYELTYIHGVNTVNRGAYCKADLDGDGLLDDETSVHVTGSDTTNVATVTFTASAEGKLIGIFDRGTHGEGDIAGLQLTAVPEPSMIVLLLTSAVACLAWRRR